VKNKIFNLTNIMTNMTASNKILEFIFFFVSAEQSDDEFYDTRTPILDNL